MGAAHRWNVNDDVTQDGPAPLTFAEVWKILRMQWQIIAGVTAVALIAGVAVNLLSDRLYRSTSVIQISSSLGKEVEVDDVVNYNVVLQKATYLKTQVDLLKSRDLREAVVRRYEGLGNTDLTVANGGVNRLTNMLNVMPRRESELVDVSVTDTDPERAATLANLVTAVYLDEILEGRRDSARDAKDWLQDQATDYRERIAEQSRSLVDFQRTHDLADIEQSTNRLGATMTGLSESYAAVYAERVLHETTYEHHKKLAKAGLWEAAAKDMDTPLVNAIITSYADAATENAQLRARYRPGMPDVVQSDAKLAGIVDELRKEVQRTLATEKAQVAIFRAKEASMSMEIDQVKADLLARQANLVEYERLKLELERTKKLYSALGERDGQLDLASRTHLSNVRVVDDAQVESRPVSPQVARNMIAALILGLVTGALIAFLVEYLDDTISSPFDVQTYLRLPFLGIVPRIDADGDDRQRALHAFTHRNSSTAEAVRSVRTVVELQPVEGTSRRILVTSSYTSEGKTNTAVSLAISFASMGRKVLLIDADLRRPRLHYVFEFPKTAGLSTVLGAGAEPRDTILASHVPNLDVLVAGPGTELPNELLASRRMEEVLDALDPRYDLILIDSPPAGILSDSAILSKLVDGVVFVVREKAISRWFIRDVVYRLRQVGAPILGAVVNNVDLHHRNAKYYYNTQYRYHPDDTSGVAAK